MATLLLVACLIKAPYRVEIRLIYPSQTPQHHLLVVVNNPSGHKDFCMGRAGNGPGSPVEVECDAVGLDGETGSVCTPTTSSSARTPHAAMSQPAGLEGARAPHSAHPLDPFFHMWGTATIVELVLFVEKVSG